MATGLIESAAVVVVESSRRFTDLRGVQWRIDLGILPSSPSSTIDDLRRVTANSRRRYRIFDFLFDPFGLLCLFLLIFLFVLIKRWKLYIFY